MRRNHEGEYLPRDKHQEVSLHERKIDFNYKQMMDKPEHNTQGELCKFDNGIIR